MIGQTLALGALQHLVERGSPRLAAVRVVAKPDRHGQLGKAARRLLALVRCRGGSGRGSGGGRGTGLRMFALLKYRFF